MHHSSVEAFWFKPFRDMPCHSYILTMCMRRIHFGEMRLFNPQAPAVVDDFGTLVVVGAWS